jgi:hypothetical protein
MKLAIALLQILMLAAGFASNGADAMAGAAVFAVLCVVVVVVDRSRSSESLNVRRMKV